MRVKSKEELMRAVPPSTGLSPVDRLGKVRRWLGVYSAEERAVLAYSKRLKELTMQIIAGEYVLRHRPEWVRQDDYRRLQKVQRKADKRRLKR